MPATPATPAMPATFPTPRAPPLFIYQASGAAGPRGAGGEEEGKGDPGPAAPRCRCRGEQVSCGRPVESPPRSERGGTQGGADSADAKCVRMPWKRLECSGRNSSETTSEEP